jgi:tripartite ATP-independent transporter DctM subunit
MIIPPSILMIIYSATTGVSVGALFLAGALPGFLIGVGQMLLSYVYALRYNYPRETRATLRELGEAFRESALALGTPVIIVGGVVGGVFTATEASLIAVLYTLFLALFVYRTITWKDLPGLFLDTAKLSSLTLFALANASIFGWLLAYFEAPDAMGTALSGMTKTSLPTLLFIIWVYLIVGTFMDATPTILILAPAFQPIAVKAGINPIFLGVVSVIVLCFGLITPPYGLCLLLASSIAKVPVHRVMRDVGIFLALNTAILILVLLIPDAVLFLPRLILPEFVR